MKISVIIPCYNCAGTIKETLDSVMNQNHNDVEIVLVNDGSRDNTNDVIEKVVFVKWATTKY